jgi:hypothetical protein
MKQSKTLRRLLVGIPVIAIAIGVVCVSLTTSDVQGAASSIEAALRVGGVDVKSVAIDEAAKVVTVNVTSQEGGRPDDAMARMLIERELISRNESGDLAAQSFTVNMLDQNGRVIDSISDMTLDSWVLVTAEVPEPSLSDRVQRYAEELATEQHIQLLSCEITQATKGTNVVAVRVAITDGEDQSEQIKRGVGLLGRIRQEIEMEQGAAIQLLRLSVEDADTSRELVDIVIDPVRRSVRGWHAPDAPVGWTISESAPLPSAQPSTHTEQ